MSLRTLEESQPRSKPVYVLIVDDDEHWARSIAGELERSGHFVLTAPLLSDGLAIVRNLNMDVVLCEEKLSDGCGHEVLDEITRPRRRPKTIVLSAREPTDCGTDGFDLKLRKPSSATSIQRAIAKLMKRSA